MLSLVVSKFIVKLSAALVILGVAVIMAAQLVGTLVPSGGEIAYVTAWRGVDMLAVIDPVRRISLNFGCVQMLTSCAAPRWSPDGTRLAFFAQQNTSPGLFVTDVDDWHTQLLRGDLTAIYVYPTETFVWSPDGQSILSMWVGSVEHGIFVVDVPQGTVKGLHAVATDHSRVAWSPDGKRIAFINAVDEQLSVMDADGENIQALTQQVIYANQPAWSPDGKQIAFVALPPDNRAATNTEIYVIDTNGKHLERLTNNATYDTYPFWMPDGSGIGFIAAGAVYAVDLDGGNLRRLVDANHVYGLSWSPDHQQIAFSMDIGGHAQIFVMDADGKNVRQLTWNTLDNYDPAWRPQP